MKISQNFNLYEFMNKKREITPIQVFMLQNLCIKILEPIRTFLNCPIKITSGIRFPGDINRLRKEGYNPSETSDHLYGNVVKLKSLNKKAKYGDYYSFSVGAADIIPAIGALSAWNILKKYFNIYSNEVNLPINNNRTINIRIGQIILEKRNSYWLHVANPSNLIYSLKFIQNFIKRKPFLISEDNGKNYTVYP